VASKDLVQLTHGKLMPELGQAAFAGDLGSRMNQFEGNKNLTDNELFHSADAIDNFRFRDRKGIRTRHNTQTFEDRVQQHQEMTRQQLCMAQDVGHRLFLETCLVGDLFREHAAEQLERITALGKIERR
jgi:hypothetical protein